MSINLKNRSLAYPIALATLLLFSACAVGPDFKQPTAPNVKHYVSGGDATKPTASVADTRTGAAQAFEEDKDIPAKWWALYQSDALNTLVDEALKASPDIHAAEAALRQAQENVYAGEGAFFPSVDAGANVTRQKISLAAYGLPGGGSSIFTLYDGALNLSYGVDIFGYNRREVESLKAQANYQRYELEAAYLSLTTNIVTAAIAEASLREQIKETQHINAIEGNELKVLKTQFELGGIAKSVELAQETTLSQSEATLPPLQKALVQTQNQLAVLAGHVPAQEWEAHFEMDGLHLPENLPVSLPAKLVSNRPDIKAAAEQLHSASAQVGVATAAMLPEITITGSFGVEAPSWSGLGASSAPVWSIGGGLLQPLFRGGTLYHQRKAAQAAYDKALAQYQSIVLQAFGNVANTLQALQYDANGLVANVHAAKAAKSNLDITGEQFKDGAISYPQLLDAQRSYAATRIALVQAEASRLADTAALFQSLGGGWQNHEQTTAAMPAQTLSKTEK